MIFPKRNSDWNCCFSEVERDFKNFVEKVAKFQKVYLISAEKLDWKIENLQIIYGIDYNDTWGRDSLGLVVSNGESEKVINYNFNAWGGKFDSTLDNQISRRLEKKGFWSDLIDIDFTIEGGAVETDGETLLITETSVLNSNRPKNSNRDEVEKSLIENLGAEKIVWLKESFLAGDDTDGHIDMLARFSKKGEILYSLPKIGTELKEKFPNHNLVKFPSPTFENFPATYLNFIFVNGGILFPTYGVSEDLEAEKIFREVFPNREIVPVDSRNFIRQGGSLHCLSMQI
ncbi:peptidylarginine deiminase-like enzyme [Thiovulum sp. ES]|nr:peptidylarginine deiminase-like enzyme [Thiovulum sp. ES]